MNVTASTIEGINILIDLTKKGACFAPIIIISARREIKMHEIGFIEKKESNHTSKPCDNNLSYNNRPKIHAL